jgi:Tol biopolymer transport system component/DNA-binding winged helix-turn-helix (wHTH) protein
METLTTKTFRFSNFELDRVRRVLLKEEKPVALNPKAFDLLLVLIESRGEVLSKDVLLERVWPGQFVEEGNLKVHISALRKIFRESKNDHRFIVTVPGRGYSFVAEVADAANGDIVIEEHSFSRILIDEELGQTSVKDVEPVVELPVADRSSTLGLTRGILVASAAFLLLTPVAYLIVRWGFAPTDGMRSNKLDIKRLTTNGRVSFAALSPDGRMFAYALKELEQNSLWLGFVEGGEDKLLRESETGRYNDLAFSADGNFVLFTFSGPDSRESVLYRIPTLGGAREKVRGKVSSVGVSPDGRQYAFGRTNSETKASQIVIAPLEGGEDVVVDLPGTRSFGAESISWSPDGGTIAFAASTGHGQPYIQVFLVGVSDGSVRQLTTYGWKEVIKTAWAEGGNSLLVVAQEKDSNTSVSYSQIWQVSMPNGGVRQLTHDLSSYRSVLSTAGPLFLTVELRQMNNVWVAPSADLSKAKQVTFGTFGKYDGLWGLDWTAGGKIVFTSTDNQSQVISEMDADGGNVRQLTAPGYNDSMVNTSNDGRYLVFESTREGGSNIWRMNADGTNFLRLTSEGHSYQPFISPDSLFVYYIRSRESGGGLFRVSIEGGASEKVSDATVAYPSISADGRSIVAGLGTRLVIFPIHGGAPAREFELTRFGTPTGNTRWSPDGKAIAYRDRGYGYWLQPLDGSEPQRMKDLPKEKFYNFAWSKDGKQFAFVRGQEIRDVVLFRGPH